MGGWTWYTGSAGWMYRVLIESILGVQIKRENELHIQPSIAPDWSEYKVTVQGADQKTEYAIRVLNPSGLETGIIKGTVDGKEIQNLEGSFVIKMKTDGKKHQAELTLVKSE